MPQETPRHAKTALLFCCVFLCTHLNAQNTPNADLRSFAWSTDSTGPRRFVSVHGRSAAIFGYPRDGLEVWAYPVQILRSYSVAFRVQGATTSIDGQTILRRIEYRPEAIIRVYAGPDFIVHEKIFVPLDERGAILGYEVEGTRSLDIEVRFIPILDLMWPASMGGQEARWSSASSAYLLSEPLHRFTATVGSPDIVAHDDTPNSGQFVGSEPGLAFTMRPGTTHVAHVVIAGSGAGRDVNEVARKLLHDDSALEQASFSHYSDLLTHALQIETPDAGTNRALAWSEFAVDQAWVCNPDVGCGLVAGYGPSRKARRPQYDWFFAGDGMVAIRALLASGQYERVREEIEFILKYQDHKTGMIWHELSQSAGLLDWRKYPYMFVHVDLTFDFLETMEKYFSVTGDRKFVDLHWNSIESAYKYCRSLRDETDGLPRIPPDKEGSREQDALSDELTLSASWVNASEAFATLSDATGHTAEGTEAREAHQQAIAAILKRYWDENGHIWISAHNRAGDPVRDRTGGPSSVMGLLPESQRDLLLDQLASSDFQADWGTRGRAASASNYEPNSYASGSVWATHTSGTADEFWAAHRPASALPVWSALVPWSALDSPGHMHEALAGDFYHEEIESVAEQTWSSATFFSSAVEGLLGLNIDGVSNRVTLAPHIPPSWNAVTLRNIHVGSSEIGAELSQSSAGIHLRLQNDGVPVEVVFDPEIPFGAKLLDTRLEGRVITARLEQHAQDTHARTEFTLPHGTTSLVVRYAGGVSLISDPPQLTIGEPSRAIKITGIHMNDSSLTVDFDAEASADSGFELRTPWTIQRVRGATFKRIGPGLYRFAVVQSASDVDVYHHGEVVVTLSGNRSN
jgi:glycogen debranching enzyme